MLRNKLVTSILQDELGVAGVMKERYEPNKQVRVWLRPLSPAGCYALALSYDNISGGPSHVSLKIQDLGLTAMGSYNFTDVFTGSHIGFYKPWHTFDCEVNP